MEPDQIACFLHFGYLTRPQGSEWCIPRGEPLERCFRVTRLPSKDESYLLERGVEALRAAFLYEEGALHVVPLSGGLDSRAILGGLIHAGLRDQIVTVTLGTPGTWDFELGSCLSQHCGVKHEAVDLTGISVEAHKLAETAKEGSDWTLLIDAYYHSLICKRFGKSVTYWSGFMGGELAGSHIPVSESTSWSDARERFAIRQRFVKSKNLTPPWFSPVGSLPPSPLVDRSVLSYDDQLDFAIRQRYYIKKVVIFAGHDYRIPFLSPEWVGFILGIPRQYRVRKRLYKKILLKAFPELFSFPIANMYGASIQASSMKVELRHYLTAIRNRVLRSSRIWNRVGLLRQFNYIDIDEAVRKREDIRSMIYESILKLGDHRILNWLDIEQLWKDHQMGRANHGMALMLLAALELSLMTLDRMEL